MILVFVIILFIILLLYKCRLFTEEKYTIGSLGIDWKNYANVSGTVNKWIMVLYDDESGNKIHETEDDSPQNLQNFMDVNLKAIENKKFGPEILGTNTLSVYYNSISDDTKVYSGDFSLSTNDFGVSVSDISVKESNLPTWSELTRKKDTLEEILGTEGTKIYVYPKDSTDDIYKFINKNPCNINDTKWWVRKTCFIQELGFEKTGDTGYFYPNFPELGHSYKYFGVNSTNKIVMTDETSSNNARQKFYLEKPEDVTDTDTVKYGKFAYETTGGDKYYMYLSDDNDVLKVAKLSDINNKSSTIFEFRYSKDCESYWTNLTETDDGKKIVGYNVFDCGPNDIHNCQYWGHNRIDAVGQGEACPSDTKVNSYVIKTQWPKKSTISELNTNFPEYLETEYADITTENTDPNKNKTLVNTPQYYKTQYDTINASINSNKAPAAPGQIVYTSSGTFTVPTGVTSLSCVVVGGGGGSTGCSGASQYSGAGGGGGGLAYGTFSVTQGSTVTVQVGAGGSAGTNVNNSTNKAGTGGESKITYGGTDMLIAYGGVGGTYGINTYAAGGRYFRSSQVTLRGGGYGGYGGHGGRNTGGGGGGGAGGYGGTGGNGGVKNYGYGSSGTAGGGGGGGGQRSGGEQNNGGGGVGLDGQGTDGLRGTPNNPGGGGSGGAGGGKAGIGGLYGGGAGGCEDDTNRSGSVGGAGGVRIIWGSGRSYPSTNTADESVAVAVAVDVDCEGFYENNWSACSATCGEGEQTKKYIITQQPIGSGTACPPLSISQTCNNDCACVPNQIFLNNPYISPASVNVATNKCDQSTDCGKGTSTVLNASDRDNQENHIINAFLNANYPGTSLGDLPTYLRNMIINGVQPSVNEIMNKTYSDVCIYKTK